MALTQDEVARLEEIIAAVGAIRGRLRDGPADGWSDRRFFDDIERRYDEEGADLFISGKMWKILERLMSYA